jgi:hypothetical protein
MVSEHENAEDRVKLQDRISAYKNLSLEGNLELGFVYLTLFTFGSFIIPFIWSGRSQVSTTLQL